MLFIYILVFIWRSLKGIFSVNFIKLPYILPVHPNMLLCTFADETAPSCFFPRSFSHLQSNLELKIGENLIHTNVNKAPSLCGLLFICFPVIFYSSNTRNSANEVRSHGICIDKQQTWDSFSRLNRLKKKLIMLLLEHKRLLHTCILELL